MSSEKKRHEDKNRSEIKIQLPVSTAVLVDGGFFLSRYKAVFENGHRHAPEQVVKNLITMAFKHVYRQNGDLYRIFFYDCRPFRKKVHNPLSSKAIDFEKSEVAQHRNKIHALLRKERKVALRYGELKDGNGWSLHGRVLKELLAGKKKLEKLQENDLYYDISQKGVDMKIGLDVASLAYKGLVKRIILVSGDSDFVPAAKLARREGIDFILDPMWSNIHDDLYEHIDGLHSTVRNPHGEDNHKKRPDQQ